MARFQSHKVGDYGGLSAPFDAERARLRDLARGLNPLTQRWLRKLGIAPGWRCFEVGAAEGSMARWLAEQVGPDGHVVAADIDVRFMADMDRLNVEVRPLDIRSAEIEKEHYDLAYCRTILLHLPDADAALAKLAGCLRPGGRLLVQDSDICLHQHADPDHPDAAFFEDFHQRMYRHIRATKMFDARFGRTLHARVEAQGIVDVKSELHTARHTGGGPAARNMQAVLERLADRLIDAGATTRAEIDRAIGMYRSPDFHYLTGLQVGVMGRKP